jgi:hypothetical protein
MLGTSFTRWRAEALGLDYRRAFTRLCELELFPIRLSAAWRELHQYGFEHLDWLLDHAGATGRPVVLTVGMKALGWPEFYLPEGLDPADRGVQRQALSMVEQVVRRYADRPAVLAWQIENEPFNRSGPQARWIPRAVVRREARAVRAIDRMRPLLITTFAHFDPGLDRSSSRHQQAWKQRLALDIPAEREALAILDQRDMLGVDVYRAIGWLDQAGSRHLARADDDQFGWVATWQRIAGEQGKRFWVTEAQAEPWEPKAPSSGDPVTSTPDAIRQLVEQLHRLEVETVLLWGSEHWLWRERQGDSRWIDAVAMGLRALA